MGKAKFSLVSKIHPWVIVSGDITLEKNLTFNIGSRYISKPYVYLIDVNLFVSVSILSILVPG